MTRTILLCGLFSIAVACTKSNLATDHRQATVHLVDGTVVAGAVTATSPSAMTVAKSDQSSQVIPMNRVRSVEYADPAPTATSPGEEGHENHYHPPQTAIKTKTYVLAAGTEVRVRAEETIDSAHAVEGQTYAAEVARDVMDADGAVVIPAGSNAKLVIKSASKGGHIKGQSDLVLDLDSVSVEGQSYHLVSTDVEERGKPGVGANRRTAEFTGGGAAIGAIIGAIAGGGKGAAIGAGAGAGAGALTQILTKGGSVHVPAETILTFKLDQALRVQQRQ